MRATFGLLVVTLLCSCDSEPAHGVKPSDKVWRGATPQSKTDATHETSVYRRAGPGRFLSDGRTLVEVFQVKASPRIEELGLKWHRGLEQHPDWWNRYRAQHSGLVPYHPNMGVTEEEYKELFNGLEQAAKIAKVGQGHLEFQWETDSICKLRAEGILRPLNDITVDLSAKVVSTPLGPLTDCTSLEPNKEQRATGPWGGHDWRQWFGNPDHGTHVTFAVGRHQETKRAVVYYNVTAFYKRIPKEEVFLFIQYPMPGA